MHESCGGLERKFTFLFCAPHHIGRLALPCRFFWKASNPASNFEDIGLKCGCKLKPAVSIAAGFLKVFQDKTQLLQGSKFRSRSSAIFRIAYMCFPSRAQLSWLPQTG